MLGHLISQRVAARERETLQQASCVDRDALVSGHFAERDALAERIVALQGEVAELQARIDALYEDLQDANTLAAAQAMELQGADARMAAQEKADALAAAGAAELEESLASSRAEGAALRERLALTEERAAAAEASAGLAAAAAAAAAQVTPPSTSPPQGRADECEAAGGEVAAPTAVTWVGLGGALPGESRPVLPGATAAVLMAHAVDLRGQLEVAGRSEPAAMSVASDLLTVLERLGAQLDAEVLDEFHAAVPTATAEPSAVRLLVLRLAGARGESGALRAVCIEALEMVKEFLEAQSGKAGMRTKRSKVDDMLAKNLSNVQQCFLAAQRGWVEMEELRRLLRIWQPTGGRTVAAARAAEEPSPPGAAVVTGTSGGGGATAGGSGAAGACGAAAGGELAAPAAGLAAPSASASANVGVVATQLRLACSSSSSEAATDTLSPAKRVASAGLALQSATGAMPQGKSTAGSQMPSPPRRISYSQIPFLVPRVSDAEACSRAVSPNCGQQTSSQRQPAAPQRPVQEALSQKQPNLPQRAISDGRMSDHGRGALCDFVHPAVRGGGGCTASPGGSGGSARTSGRRRASDGSLSNVGKKVITSPDLILGSGIDEEQRCLAVVSNPLRTSTKNNSSNSTGSKERAVVTKCSEATLRVAPRADTGVRGSTSTSASS